MEEAEFLHGVEQRGIHLREFEGEVVFTAELDLLPESAVGAEIEELVDTTCAVIQPGAGFFTLVQALERPGGESAELIEVKPRGGRARLAGRPRVLILRQQWPAKHEAKPIPGMELFDEFPGFHALVHR
ncbi:MAG: hypothetical protein NTY98_05095 [Verrucomicrobia bacterium]|nr:hypothetical protein [Verrucomicrobiota bacterium]